MTLNKETINKVVKTQTTIWILAILFASAYALFAKLIWTANFPILIFLPMLLLGFAMASINNVRSTLMNLIDKDN